MSVWSRRPKGAVGREASWGAWPWLSARREPARPGRPEACRWRAAEARAARGTLWREPAGPWGATLRRELARGRAALGWEALLARRPTHAAGHGTGVRTWPGRSTHRRRTLAGRGDGVGAHRLTGHA